MVSARIEPGSFNTKLNNTRRRDGRSGRRYKGIEYDLCQASDDGVHLKVESGKQKSDSGE
jgi:hypothetical protein